MKRTRVIGLGFYVIMLLAVSGTLMAGEDQPLTATVSVNYYTKYVWRGQNVNDTSVLQPSISGSAYGFTGSIWANIDMTNQSQTVPENAMEFSEIDYSLDYSSDVPGIKKLGFSTGVIHYLFPNTSLKSTTEIYAGINVKAPLNPRLTWYGDVNSIEGNYLQFSLGHSFEKLATWSNDYSMGLSLSGSIAWASAGYNRGYFGIDANKFNDLTVGIIFPINLKHVTISPSLNMSTMLSERIGDATYERNNIWFGVGLSKSF